MRKRQKREARRHAPSSLSLSGERAAAAAAVAAAAKAGERGARASEQKLETSPRRRRQTRRDIYVIKDAASPPSGLRDSRPLPCRGTKPDRPATCVSTERVSTALESRRKHAASACIRPLSRKDARARGSSFAQIIGRRAAPRLDGAADLVVLPRAHTRVERKQVRPDSRNIPSRAHALASLSLSRVVAPEKKRHEEEEIRLSPREERTEREAQI